MRATPRTDPYVRNYLIRLLPWDERTGHRPLARRACRCFAFRGSESAASKTCVSFPLVDPLPSTDSAAAFGPALFACFFGAMGPSDSLETCVSAVWQMPSRTVPRQHGEGASRVSRFPCKEFPRMRTAFGQFNDECGTKKKTRTFAAG